MGLQSTKGWFLTTTLAAAILVLLCDQLAAAAAPSTAACARYSDAGARALCQQVFAWIRQDPSVGGPAAASSQTAAAAAEAQYDRGEEDEQQREPWYHHAHEPDTHSYYVDDREGELYPRDRHAGEGHYGYGSHHVHHPHHPSAPRIRMYPQGSSELEIDVIADLSNLGQSGSLPSTNFSASATLKRTARLSDKKLPDGWPLDVDITEKTLAITQEFRTKAPVQLVVTEPDSSNRQTLVLTAKMVPDNRALIYVGRKFPWQEAASYEVMIPKPQEITIYVYDAQNPGTMWVCYGFAQVTNIRASPVATTQKMMAYLKDGLFAHPSEFDLEVSADLIFIHCLPKGSEHAPAAARSSCDALTDFEQRQHCHQMLDMLSRQDTAAGHSSSNAPNNLQRHPATGGRDHPSSRSADGSHAQVLHTDSPDYYHPGPGRRGDADYGYGEDKEGEEEEWRRFDGRHHYHHHSRQPPHMGTAYEQPCTHKRRNDPFSPSSHPPAGNITLESIAYSSMEIRVDALNTTFNTTGRLTQLGLRDYVINTERWVWLHDAANTPDTYLLITQPFKCNSPTPAEFFFIGPVYQPKNMSAKCVMEPSESFQSTIQVGVKFPWRSAISTKVTVPSPTELYYNVNWPDSAGDLTNPHQYLAAVTRIKSPMAFEGGAVDLLLDVLTGQPPRYNMEVAANSFFAQ